MIQRAVKILLSIALLTTLACAGVTLQGPQSFVKNQPYFFTIVANGDDIVFPTIDKIDTYVVEKAGTSRSISNINGKITQKLMAQFRLYPTANFTIPSYEVIIDGKKHLTQAIDVKKEQLSQTKSKHFEFNLLASKQELYVGEDVLITLQFKYKKDVQITNLGLSSPSFENFWQKKLDANRRFEQGDFIVQELDFLIFPQKSGKLTIEPINIDVSVLDLNNNPYSFFNNSTKNIRVYSNALNFEVKPLPNGIDLIGDFTITSSVDKSTIKQGEGINYKIEINGWGNIDDMQDIKLDIQNATIYENKAQIKTQVVNKRYAGNYKKSFSILPTQSMTVPSVQLSFFDQTTQSVKTIRTTSHTINVEQATMKPTNVLQKSLPSIKQTSKTVQNSSKLEVSWQEKLTYFLMGVLVCLLSIGLYFYVINRGKDKTKTDSLLLKILSGTKSKDELIKMLLPYIDFNDEVKAFIFKVEKSESTEFKVLKKEAKHLIKKYNIEV